MRFCLNCSPLSSSDLEETYEWSGDRNVKLKEGGVELMCMPWPSLSLSSSHFKERY